MTRSVLLAGSVAVLSITMGEAASAQRIIHVPQASDYRAARTNVDDDYTSSVIDDEEPVAVPKARRVVVTTPPVERKPRRVLPPVNEPKRTVLSVPPPAPELTPIRPLPKWNAGEKNSALKAKPQNDATAGLPDVLPDANAAATR